MSIDWDTVALGQRSDAALAESLGLCTDQVRWARRARGIDLTDRARAEADARRRAGSRKGFAAMDPHPGSVGER